jgi:hypothetical protein
MFEMSERCLRDVQMSERCRSNVQMMYRSQQVAGVLVQESTIKQSMQSTALLISWMLPRIPFICELPYGPINVV